MTGNKALERPQYIQAIGHNALRLTRASHQALRAFAKQGWRQMRRDPKAYDEMLKAYVDAMPDHLVEKCLAFIKTTDGPKAGGED